MKKKNAMLSFGREDAVKTGRFLAFFIVVYILLSFSVKAIFPVETIELWVANNVLAFLQLLGYSGTVSFGETAIIQLDAAGPAIEISELCTGLIETLIVVGAIIASIGIGWRKRLFGAVTAGLAVIVLNYARIVFTVLLILGTNDLAVIDFTHNVLFRAFLFVSIAGIYIAWFYWAASSEMGRIKEK
ncbi:MAG: exosortase/archaeosortase family protein [archaeon]